MTESIVLSIVGKATLVLTLGLLVVQLMRCARASRRFLVLAWSFALLAILPLAVVVTPTIPIVVQSRQVVAPVASAPASPAAAVPRPPTATALAGNSPKPGTRDAMGAVVAVAWAAGVAISLFPVLAAMRRLRMLRRTARAFMRHDAGRHVPVLVHDELRAPMTFGWIQPVVLLPGDVESWTGVEVERALVHELEHVRRRDWPIHVLARLVCAFYWFHPLVWQAWRRLHVEADRACDDAVVSCGNASEFAEQLVALATRIVSVHSPALSMAGGDLVTRVHALLNPRQARGRSGTGYATLVAAAALVLGSSAAAVQPVHRTTFERLAPIAVPAAVVTQDPAPRRPPVAAGRAATQANSPAPSRPFPPPATVQPVPQSPAATVIPPQEYVIGFGDVLTISYWGQKDLSADVVVRPDGKITLPLINDVEAAGLTPQQLRDRLMQASVKFLQDPNITVGVRAINSRRVYVSGGVVKPGAYDLVNQLTVLNLIAVAGGLREFVTGRNILIVRTEDGKQIALPFDYREVLAGQNLEQNIVLRPGDTVVVPD